MKKRIKFVLIGFIGIFCFTFLFLHSLGILSSIPGLSNINDDDDWKDDYVNEPQSFVENITLIVDYGSGDVDIWEDFNLTGKTTVFDALDKWCEIDYDDYGWSVFILEINGVRNEDPDYWFYGVNDKIAPVGCSKYNLLDGDTINWVYDTSYHPP